MMIYALVIFAMKKLNDDLAAMTIPTSNNCNVNPSIQLIQSLTLLIVTLLLVWSFLSLQIPNSTRLHIDFSVNKSTILHEMPYLFYHCSTV